MNNKEIRKQFPIADKITYFDSAALVLKPQIAIDAVTDFYTNKSISSRTADTPLGSEIAQVVANVRTKVGNLIDATDEEIIFTSGTTESLNVLALMSENILNEGDEILLCTHNHSSNIVPWIEIAKRKNATVVYSENPIENLNSKTKILSISQETNNFNVTFDVHELFQAAKQFEDLMIVSDAAQAIIHEKVSLKEVDAIAFSTNKFYGPTGLGILAVKKAWLKKMKPAKYGGGSITEITCNSSWGLRDTIAAFEPGTPNLAGIFMFDKSIDFFNQIGYAKTNEILKDLSHYLHSKLAELDNVDVYSNPGDNIAIINVKGIHPQDVATYLGKHNIYTRAGIFCALYLVNILKESAYLRISLGIYNTYEDIDYLIEVLKNGGDFYAF
ncbi:aminotransferase class V-fold PLP-dependent enzyme [Mycoplasma hafezii]|uniref:aminotransferase class V-fold PLP-dependent enzyme n=1 Tax=Mycoplasma hafezii TaxID=525886 RepID=UPI003CED0A78